MYSTRTFVIQISLCCALLLVGCQSSGDDNPTRTEINTPQDEELPFQFQTDHFYFYCDEADVIFLNQGADTLEANYNRVLTDLELNEMQVIKVKVWRSAEDFYQCMLDDLGIIYQGATGYLAGYDEMRLLLPNVGMSTFVHEFAHLVSMQVNPQFSNNPR